MANIQVSLKHLRMSPDKIRPILPLIKGKKPDDALAILNNVPRRGALPLSKLIKAGFSAAKDKNLIENDLIIMNIFCNEGSKLKRFRFESKGRTSEVAKRSSHIQLILSDGQDENKTKQKPEKKSAERKNHGS